MDEFMNIVVAIMGCCVALMGIVTSSIMTCLAFVVAIDFMKGRK